MVSYRDNLMTCEEAKDTSLLYIKGDPSLTPEQREAFEAHLLACPACAEEHEENRWLCDLLRRYGTISESTEQLLQNAGYEVEDDWGCRKQYRPMTVEEGWEDLKRRCPSLAEACRRQERQKRRQKVLWRVGALAAAACVLVAVGIGWLTPRAGDSNLSSSAHSSALPASVELITPEGRKPLALNLPVDAADQPQEILLSGMHRVVMNRQTTATFKAARASTQQEAAAGAPQLRYEIELAQGELFVEVVPGHPFTVKTDNALLQITGTRFDVRAEPGRTHLTLLKGSARFSQANAVDQFVDVTAGHASTIAGRSAPTAPCETDALAATAWARDLALRNAIARVQPEADLHLLDSMHDFWPQASPINLESIDYVKWRDDHRDWFARQFPWTFKVQKVLKDQYDIEADYIDLLLVSGDIWQFNYPRSSSQPIPISYTTSVTRTAWHYQIEPTELLAALDLNLPKTPSDRPVEDVIKQYRSALGLWQSDVAGLSTTDRSEHGDLLLFTLRAGTYLSNTRTAAWLWLRAHPEQAAALSPWQALSISRDFVSRDTGGTTSASCRQWLSQLAREIAAADHVGRLGQELITVPSATGCQTQATILRTELAETVAGLLKPEGTQ